MFYKNTSYTAKTFYGVTFKPGETKEVDKQINVRCMIPATKPVSSPEVQQKPSSDKPKKEPVKAEEPKVVDPAKEPEVPKQQPATNNKESKS